MYREICMYVCMYVCIYIYIYYVPFASSIYFFFAYVNTCIQPQHWLCFALCMYFCVWVYCLIFGEDAAVRKVYFGMQRLRVTICWHVRRCFYPYIHGEYWKRVQSGLQAYLVLFVALRSKCAIPNDIVDKGLQEKEQNLNGQGLIEVTLD